MPADPRSPRRNAELDEVWARHSSEWRAPAQIVSQWEGAAETDARLLRYRVRGPFWELLADAAITLIVTREYEHLVVALSAVERPEVSFLRLPHPSGLVADRARGTVHVASTRNPNQIYVMKPVGGLLARSDIAPPLADHRPLVTVSSHFYPGALYLHDLAVIDGYLHGNAVGENAVVRFNTAGTAERVWWPRVIEQDGSPDFSRNYLQLNSIAAGDGIGACFFTASSDRVSARRPGHRNYPVDGRGVLFSGATREPVAGGLTRPHSARLHEERVWVDNSGYGEVSVLSGSHFEPIARLPGWTRGLCFAAGLAFVGVSRVIPRFRRYAPGLDVDRSVCGVFAVDAATGATLASLTWPQGNQIFGLDWVPQQMSRGLPFPAGADRRSIALKNLFYAFQVNDPE